DQARTGDGFEDRTWGRLGRKINGVLLSSRRLALPAGEQPLVVVAAPDRPFGDLLRARPAVPRRLPRRNEVPVRLQNVHVRVLRQVARERRRSGFRRADY